jgi:hypothetical protein
VTFMMDRQSYTRSDIKSIQILQYKALKTEYLVSDSSIAPNDMLPQQTAEVTIIFAQNGEETSKDDTDRIRLYSKLNGVEALNSS